MGKKFKEVEDNRDIFDKVMESPAPMIAGMLAGGVAGRAFGKAKKAVGRKRLGDEGFKGAMAGGLAGGAYSMGHSLNRQYNDAKKKERRK